MENQILFDTAVMIFAAIALGRAAKLLKCQMLLGI